MKNKNGFILFVFFLGLVIGLLLGCIFGMIYQQERMMNGIVDFGESLTGNNIIIDVNETVFAQEFGKVIEDIREQEKLDR